MITWSPGDEGRARVTDLMRQALPGHRIELHLLDSGPLAPFLERFAGSPGYSAWRDGLATSGLTHLHFVFLSTSQSECPRVDILSPHEAVSSCHSIAAAWL